MKPDKKNSPPKASAPSTDPKKLPQAKAKAGAPRKAEAAKPAAASEKAKAPRVSAAKTSPASKPAPKAAATPAAKKPAIGKSPLKASPEKEPVSKEKTAAPAEVRKGSAKAPKTADSKARPASSRAQPAAKAEAASLRAPTPASAPAPAAAKPAPRKPAEEKAAVAAPKKAVRSSGSKTSKPALQIPPILLEGDQAPATAASGPGKRYALGPKPPAEQFAEEQGELPEGYGTQQLFLAASDPRWLYASWDLTNSQIKQYNSLSADKHMVLRVYLNSPLESPIAEVHVHPESRSWFIPVPNAGARYVGVLGYYRSRNHWVTVSTSKATLTPPDTLAEDTTARFATIPIDVPFQELISLVRSALRQSPPLADAIQQLRRLGHKDLPGPSEIRQARWTAAQERALASIISLDTVRRLWIGSLEITELVRRQLGHDISSGAVSQFSLPTSPAGALSSLSSPFGGAEKRRGFWFNVNAELIIYGATEPDAGVTIGGRTIKLRPDGTFSFRFILPDGNYDLPVAATSADQVETRAARLQFARTTDYRGDVGAHPQNSELKRPEPANVA